MSRRASTLLAAIVVIIVAAGLGFWFLRGSGNGNGQAAVSANRSTPTATRTASSAASAATDPKPATAASPSKTRSWSIDEAVGKPDAPVTVAEYFSLDCPHCAAFAADDMPEIRRKLIDTGRVKWVYRDFPLSDVALAAAMVAHCSGDRYEAFVSTFLSSQAGWAVAKDPTKAIKAIAKLGGMSTDQVDACLNNADLMKEIKARQTEAEKTLGIDSTPSFLINGKLVVGERSYDQFVKLLPDTN